MPKQLIKSFPDCPNGCENGFIFNFYSHTSVECDYCAKKRLELVKNGGKMMDSDGEEKDVETLLHLPKSIVGTTFDMRYLIDSSDADVTQDSKTAVQTALTELFQKISAGSLPEHSYLINLGRKANTCNFIAPLLKRAYIAGLDIAPYANSDDLRLIYQRSMGTCNDTDAISEVKLAYSDYLKADLVCVRMLASTDRYGVLFIKGFVQARAERGKPTLILTDVWNGHVMELAGNDVSYSMCELISVKYKASVQEAPKVSSNPFGDII